jgi:hypothetical protein
LHFRVYNHPFEFVDLALKGDHLFADFGEVVEEPGFYAEAFFFFNLPELLVEFVEFGIVEVFVVDKIHG